VQVEEGLVRDCRSWEWVDHVTMKDDSQLNAYVQMGEGEPPENRLQGWQNVSNAARM